MTNTTQIVTENGAVEIPLGQKSGHWQISIAGTKPADATVTLETSVNGADWAPCGRDAVDAQLSVPGTVNVRATVGFRYRINVTGGMWAAQSFQAWFEPSHA